MTSLSMSHSNSASVGVNDDRAGINKDLTHRPPVTLPTCAGRAKSEYVRQSQPGSDLKSRYPHAERAARATLHLVLVIVVSALPQPPEPSAVSERYVPGVGHRAQGFRLRVQGLGFRASGLRLRD